MATAAVATAAVATAAVATAAVATATTGATAAVATATTEVAIATATAAEVLETHKKLAISQTLVLTKNGLGLFMSFALKPKNGSLTFEIRLSC